NYKELYGVVNNLVDTITDEVYEQIIDGAKLNWKSPVDSENDLPTSANEGDAVMTRDDGKVYRYDGSQWREIQQIDAGPVNVVDSRLSSQLADTDDYLSKSGITNRRTPYPMITWIDDDGKKGLFTKLYLILERRGVPLTAAIIPNRVGINGNISETEIKEMMVKGLEIVSHTNEHDPNDRPIDLPKERLREGYRSAKKKIIEWGGNHRGVVYPFGNYNKTIYDVAREYHDYAFDIGTLGGIVEPPINSYKITRYNPMNKSISDIKNKLDEAYDKNAWIIIISHVDEGTYDEAKSIELIDYAISKGFE